MTTTKKITADEAPAPKKYIPTFKRIHDSPSRTQGKKRVILQHRESHRYLIKPNEWTKDRAQASDFGRLLEAKQFVRLIALPQMDAIMEFGDMQFDLRFSASPDHM